MVPVEFPRGYRGFKGEGAMGLWLLDKTRFDGTGNSCGDGSAFVPTLLNGGTGLRLSGLVLGETLAEFVAEMDVLSEAGRGERGTFHKLA